MRRAVLLCAVCVLPCLAAGCVTHSAGIAPATRPLAPGGFVTMNQASGTSWGFNLLGIPFSQARTASALEDALQDGGGDALIQVTVDNSDYYLLIMYLQRVKVEGRAVRMTRPTPTP